MTTMEMEKCYVYVGTYTRNNDSQGIYVYRLDLSSGELESLSDTGGAVRNPSYLAIHPSGEYLYAVAEIEERDGGSMGAVGAFAIDGETGALKLLNQESSGGPGPCYVSVDSAGRYVFVANYSGGSVAMLPLQGDGRLLPHSDFHQHEGGSGVNPRRQDRAHAHCAYPDPDDQYLYVPDLGLDRVVIYRLDLTEGKLIEHGTYGQVPAGAGPRHFTIHPNQKFAYVINELASTITAYRFDQSSGDLEAIETVSALPEDYEGESYCADVHISPDGRFLYGSNRGHDSIVIMAIDGDKGTLSPVGFESTQGEYPRNFALDPTGSYLFAANQNTDNIVGYRIDKDTGKLTPTGVEIQVPTPVCIKMLPII